MAKILMTIQAIHLVALITFIVLMVLTIHNQNEANLEWCQTHTVCE